jgi:hypothetical protein
VGVYPLFRPEGFLAVDVAHVIDEVEHDAAPVPKDLTGVYGAK